MSRGVTKHWAYCGLAQAGNYLIVAHDNGLVKMIPVDEKSGPVVVNALPDDIDAQPFAEGSTLYLLTLTALYRFEETLGNKE